MGEAAASDPASRGSHRQGAGYAPQAYLLGREADTTKFDDGSAATPARTVLAFTAERGLSPRSPRTGAGAPEIRLPCMGDIRVDSGERGYAARGTRSASWAGSAASIPATGRATRSYSPITAQSRPIMMKKPLNSAIRPMPP